MEQTRKQIVEKQQDLKDKMLLDFGTNEELVKGIEKDEFDQKYKDQAVFTEEAISLFILDIAKAIEDDKPHEKEILEKAKKDLSGLERKKVLLGEDNWTYMWVSKSITSGPKDEDFEKGEVEKSFEDEIDKAVKPFRASLSGGTQRGKKAQVGEVRMRADGTKWQKQGDGSWKPMPEGKKKEGEKLKLRGKDVLDSIVQSVKLELKEMRKPLNRYEVTRILHNEYRDEEITSDESGYIVKKILGEKPEKKDNIKKGNISNALGGHGDKLFKKTGKEIKEKLVSLESKIDTKITGYKTEMETLETKVGKAPTEKLNEWQTEDIEDKLVGMKKYDWNMTYYNKNKDEGVLYPVESGNTTDCATSKEQADQASQYNSVVNKLIGCIKDSHKTSVFGRNLNENKTYDLTLGQIDALGF